MNDAGLSTEFVSAARRIGRNVPFWTQGAGGNISEKRDGRLFVKASGARLDAIPKIGTVARLDLATARADLADLLAKLRISGPGAALEEEYGDFVKRRSLERETYGRASMETGFHLALPRRFVLHFHALGAVLMTHAHARGTADVPALFAAADLTLGFVPATQPGLELTERLARDPRPEVLLLENHGVILQGDSLDVLDRWQTTERKFLENHYPKFARFQISTLADADEWTTRPMPLRHYFPDSAVFSAELRALLRREGDLVSLAADDTRPETLALREIWAATALLHAMCPELGEVPDDWVATLAQLPTEKFRRNGAPS